MRRVALLSGERRPEPVERRGEQVEALKDIIKVH
jgi:hypothetical protein